MADMADMADIADMTDYGLLWLCGRAAPSGFSPAFPDPNSNAPQHR